MTASPDFARSRSLTSYLLHSAETDSTNRELLTGAADLPNWAVSVTDLQTAGRGRSGRSWEAPAGSSLLASVLIRPLGVAATEFGWLPLIAGLSMANAISSFGGAQRAGVKWPNDLLIEEKKVCGILSELLPDASGVVIGSGVNVFQRESQLPIDTATSLAIRGISVASLDELLALYLVELKRNIEEFESVRGDVDACTLRSRIKDACISLGRQVRVILPNQTEFIGEAIDIDPLGRLVVRSSSDTISVAAGDVVHLRHN
jgi:BirA family biotin operon repressor/biotin-[acetyl-CoA-carboxylase] ligase